MGVVDDLQKVSMPALAAIRVGGRACLGEGRRVRIFQTVQTVCGPAQLFGRHLQEDVLPLCGYAGGAGLFADRSGRSKIVQSPWWHRARSAELGRFAGLGGGGSDRSFQDSSKSDVSRFTSWLRFGSSCAGAMERRLLEGSPSVANPSPGGELASAVSCAAPPKRWRRPFQ